MNVILRTAVITAALALTGAAAAAQRTATLEVRNVSCASCAPIVKSALSRVFGVSSVAVVERDGMATASVTFDDAKVATDALTKATRDAGFPSTVKDVKAVSTADTIKGVGR